VRETCCNLQGLKIGGRRPVYEDGRINANNTVKQHNLREKITQYEAQKVTKQTVY